MLAVMFSGRHPFSKDREGRYFIDRDGQFFGHILSYLRSDALPPEDAALFVLREAEFFCLQVKSPFLQLFRERERDRQTDGQNIYPSHAHATFEALAGWKKK